MAKKQIKYRVYGLRNEDYEIPGGRMPGEKKRIIEDDIIDIDWKCFKKSKHEREILKLAKMQNKLESLHN